MVIQLTSMQRDLLVQLLADELDEIGPEIRHATISAYKHDLQDERRELRDLFARLTALTADDSGTPVAPLTSSGAIGVA